MVLVVVRDNNVQAALRKLKKKVVAEGILREMRDRVHFTKPSEKRKAKRAAARKRTQRQQRERAAELGLSYPQAVAAHPKKVRPSPAK